MLDVLFCSNVLLGKLWWLSNCIKLCVAGLQSPVCHALFPLTDHHNSLTHQCPVLLTCGVVGLVCCSCSAAEGTGTAVHHTHS